jgi:predicted  nucleic acid-binding Zn-ribbon protein
LTREIAGYQAKIEAASAEKLELENSYKQRIAEVEERLATKSAEAAGGEQASIIERLEEEIEQHNDESEKKDEEISKLKQEIGKLKREIGGGATPSQSKDKGGEATPSKSKEDAPLPAPKGAELYNTPQKGEKPEK